MSSAETRTKKKPNGTGRKKIEIKKIEKNSSRKVAFSKRRKGLFKKSSELCRLCDAMVAVVVFSPKGRVYTFGYPSVDSVIDHFLSEEDQDNGERGGTSLSDDTNEKDCVSESSVAEEAAEKGEEEEEEEEEEEDGRYWWEEDIEGLEMEELEKRKACMEGLRHNMVMTMEEKMMRRVCERDLLGGGLVPR